MLFILHRQGSRPCAAERGKMTIWIEIGKLLVSAVTALATVTIAIWASNLDTKQFRSEMSRSVEGPFYESQLELSIKAADIAARLASEDDPERWKDARVDFWTFYWGPLAVVENQEVIDAMVSFGKEVDIREPVPTLPATNLRTLAIRLARAVRRQTEASWQVRLPEVQIQE
jgi:hypothetical protein